MVGSSNLLHGPYIKSLKGWDSNRDGLSTPTTTLIGIRDSNRDSIHPNYHLDWDSWSLKIKILQ